jgi:hypothetical protein
LEKIPQASHEKLKLYQSLLQLRSETDTSVGERLRETLVLASKKQMQSSKQIVLAVCGSLFAAAEGREELFR